MRKIWETGIILFAAMGFWGMIYPDLCFTEDVCSEVCEGADGDETKAGSGKDVADGDGGTTKASGNATETGTKSSRAGANGDGGNMEKDIFTRICSAEPGQIRIKSRFLEMIGLDTKPK